MENEDMGGGRVGSDSLATKLNKTMGNAQWLAQEIGKMRRLDPNSNYNHVLNSFEHVSDGIQKVKETLDPMYDHYEVVPKKIVTENKINDMTTLISPKKDDGLKRHEVKVKREVMEKLFGIEDKEVDVSDHRIAKVYK